MQCAKSIDRKLAGGGGSKIEFRQMSHSGGKVDIKSGDNAVRNDMHGR